MKRKTTVVLIMSQIILLAFVFKVNAQEKINTYSMSALNEKETQNFDISLSNDQDLWIDVFSPYNPGVRCGLKLDDYHKSNFIYTVMQAKTLFTVWKKMAIENNLQDIKKKMHFIFFTDGYFTYNDKLKHDENVQIIFAFTYFRNDYVLIIGLDNMTDNDNNFISFEGGSIIFNSELEIDSFLDKISREPVSNFQTNTKP